MEAVDTLISARWVIPIEPATSVLERHSVAIRQGRIVAIVPTAEAAQRFSARETVDRPTHVLLPGLVNAFVEVMPAPFRLKGHGAAAGVETFADTQPWEGSPDPERVRDVAELILARMISSGTTCFAYASLFPEAIARVAADMHLRTCIGLPILERPTSWGASIDDYFDKASALHDEYSAEPLISTAFTTSGVSLLKDSTLERLRRDADEIELPVMMPLHESADEVALSVARFGLRPLARIERLGLATPLLIGRYLTQLDEADIDTLQKTGVHAIACPRSSLRHRIGACPLVALNDRSVNAGLGTAAAAPDLQGEMRLAGLLGNPEGTSAASLSPHDVLRMATLGGARALGIADATGSLAPGKWADLCCIDLSVLQTQPVFDLPEQLVETAEQDQVTDVWVAGRALLASGNLVRVDIANTVARAARWIS